MIQYNIEAPVKLNDSEKFSKSHSSAWYGMLAVSDKLIFIVTNPNLEPLSFLQWDKAEESSFFKLPFAFQSFSQKSSLLESVLAEGAMD